MRPPHAVRTFTLVCLLAAVTAVGDDTPPVTPIPQEQPARLIARLNADSPRDRDDAVDRLVGLNKRGRTACRRALAAATPQQRVGIDRVLLHIPWTTVDDPPGVADAFQNYPALDSDSRQRQLISDLRIVGAGALPAWVRVLRRDPSPAVRWEAARYVRYYIDDNPDVARQLIELTADVGSRAAPFDPEGDDVLPVDRNYPLLAVAGWALRGTQPERAAELMGRALDAEKADPHAFNRQAAFAYGWLIERASSRRDFKTVVALCRQQACCVELLPGTDPDASIADLFAEQCAHGPFDGFKGDLQTYEAYLGQPQILYALAVLADHRRRPGVAGLIRRAAMLASGRSSEDHFAVALFLARQHWDDDAERECNRCLALAGANRFNINFKLWQIAIDRDDYFSAARYLQAALAEVHDPASVINVDRFGKPIPFNLNLNYALVDVNYLRAARLSGDVEAARDQLEKLLALDSERQVFTAEPSMASDVVPELDSLGRHEEADRIFDAAYKSLADTVRLTPEDPMAKNNLAWLLAESDRHLDQAVALAAEAAAANPYEADVLDTQAEALFKIGRKKEAAEIETRAAEYKPQSRMIAAKADRYREASAKK